MGIPCNVCPSQNLKVGFVERKYIKLIHNEVNKSHHRITSPKPRVLRPYGPCNLGFIFTHDPYCLHTHGHSDFCFLLAQHFPDLDLAVHNFWRSLAFISLISFLLCLDDLPLSLLYLCDYCLLGLPTELPLFFCNVITWKHCRMPRAAPHCPAAPVPHHKLPSLVYRENQWVCSCCCVPSVPFLWSHL